MKVFLGETEINGHRRFVGIFRDLAHASDCVRDACTKNGKLHWHHIRGSTKGYVHVLEMDEVYARPDDYRSVLLDSPCPLPEGLALLPECNQLRQASEERSEGESMQVFLAEAEVCGHRRFVGIFKESSEACTWARDACTKKGK
ncbi:MAG: hypothetical protein OIF34_01040, partial [Porticoccaceae bacterium]|nr:hypothetical protein [Porticoccaceae bacterium]